MAKASAHSARDRLRAWLESHLVDIGLGEPSHEAQALEQLLDEAIEGLAALDGGEVPAIFAPAKIQGWYKKKYTVRQLKIMAVALVALLKELGYSVAKARTFVASHYGETDEAVRRWTRDFARSNPEGLAQAKAATVGVYRTWKRLGWHYKIPHALKQVESAGRQFYKAREGKKPGKK